MTPPVDFRGDCSVCGRRDVHRDWCARIAQYLDDTNPFGPEWCTHPGCDRMHHAKGYCEIHYKRSVTGRPMDAPPPPVRGTCESADCDRPHVARGMCGLHYYRWRKAQRKDAA